MTDEQYCTCENLSVVEFHTVRRSSLDVLDNTVNTMLGLGWQPQGGIATDDDYFYISMVRYK